MISEKEMGNVAGLPVHGYQPQNMENVEIVNRNKEMEEHCLRIAEAIRDDGRFDAQCAQTAFIKLQEAFMWLNRAVFQPKRLELPVKESE